MNIYEETKVITHEEVRKILNTTEMGESPTRLLERKLKIHDYIAQQELKDERAKKVEELLGLYKQLSIIYEKLYTMELSLLSLNSNYYEIEIIKLKEQIKALEKELELIR